MFEQYTPGFRPPGNGSDKKRKMVYEYENSDAPVYRRIAVSDRFLWFILRLRMRVNIQWRALQTFVPLLQNREYLVRIRSDFLHH
ncbi:hypothetical protein [Nitrosomonas aestuarii]|uniref:hypothetical protein n=1 Tax=Nitrosomonas aestuarii TaxID=52441 RepID=UPI000B82933E